jgi:hypothetical protein
LKGNGWSYRSTAAWLRLCCSRATQPTVSRDLMWFPNRPTRFPNRPTRFHNLLTRSSKYSKIRPRQLQAGADGKLLAGIEQRRPRMRDSEKLIYVPGAGMSVIQ